MAFLRNVFKAASISAAIALIASAGLAYAGIDVSGFNDWTGPNSENESIFETEREIDIRGENDFNIDNDYETEVITGENEIDENTVVEDIVGGDIDVSVSSENVDFVGGLGFFDLQGLDWGDIDVFAGNEITGPRSENENLVFANQEIDVELENDIDIRNDVDFEAITGFNEIEENTSVGDIYTGDVSFDADLSSSDSWVGGGLSTLDLGDFFANDISADFENSTTGPNSENINKLEANQEAWIELENDIRIDNDIDLEADTGNNEIEENTVVGDIETGSVRFDVLVD